jgi:LacI family transcriptional regulator
VQAARNAVMHLVLLGYTRIATITGDMNQISGLDRFQGYVNALLEAELPFTRLLVAEGDYSEESGYKRMQQLLKQKPEAVFVASDMMAYGAMRALREAGLRIPEDVAIVGFDDLSSSENTIPPLTTVRQPIPKMGSLSAEALIDLIKSGSSEKKRLIVGTELVVRQSCGAHLKRVVSH